MEGYVKGDAYPFLAGGGEMGLLIRSYDWSTTSIGVPAQWPQSLRTALSIILHSKFPMFLFWGEELLCFYNDAYRPSLGNEGKHPGALGKPAEAVWPESWPVIKPLIDQVLGGGEATWSEDQLIPIYRNGHLEDVYWSFSYSPVFGETGFPVAVFVTCTETTEKVNNFQRLEESKGQLGFAIEATELGTFEYNPRSNKFSANERTKEWFGFLPADEFSLDDAINAIHPHDRQRVVDAIGSAMRFASGGGYEVEYVIVHLVTGKETVVRAKGRAWFDAEGVAFRFYGTLQDVSKAVLAQKKLEESERNLRSIILQAPVAIAIFRSRQYVVEIVNDRALELWGRTGEEVLGRRILELMPELVPQGIGALLDQVYDTGESFYADELPVQLERAGQLVLTYINFVYEPLYDASGMIDGIMTLGFDVSEQVLNRQRIEESEQRMQRMVEHAPFPIGVYIGQEMRIALANQSIKDVWGKGNDVEGRLFAEVLPELHNQQVYAQLDQVYKSGEPFHVVNQRMELVVGGVLRTFYFNYNFTPLYDASGQVYGVMNTAADVTDLNVAKRRVEESEERFRKVADSAPVLIWMSGVDKLCNFFNTAWLEFRGRTMEQELGNGWAEGVHPDDLAWCLEEYSSHFEARTAFHREYRMRRYDGVYRWISDNGVVRFTADGVFEGYIGACVDIHDQKLQSMELERIVAERTGELAQKNSTLEKLNKELQLFAYVSSHDLQEPLRKIQTFSDLILEAEASNLSERGRFHFGRIQHSARRMQTLIEDLLSYSQAGNGERVFEQTDLTKMVVDVEVELRESIQKAGATLEVGELGMASGVTFQLHQLMVNLVSNALKFASPDRKLVVRIYREEVMGVELGWLSEGVAYCHLVVQDNGIGFEPEFSERIFQVFQRLHNNAKYQGTGIGLAIVKKIVENHHGVIKAYGVLGEGARFDVYLPV